MVGSECPTDRCTNRSLVWTEPSLAIRRELVTVDDTPESYRLFMVATDLSIIGLRGAPARSLKACRYIDTPLFRQVGRQVTAVPGRIGYS
jgi:hypothetical protein